MVRGRHGLTLALAVALIAAVPADGTRQEAPLVPLVGETTVSAPAGVHGIRFSVPDGARIDMHKVRVHEFDGDYAQVLSYSPEAPASSCLERFCTHYAFRVAPDWYGRNEHGLLTDEQYNNGLLGAADCETDAGDGPVRPCLVAGSVLEFYIAADAPLTFTMLVDDVPGKASYRADGEVDGELVELPTDTCPGGDCERWEIGHAVRSAGTDERPGAVDGFGYARASYDSVASGVGANVTASLSANGAATRRSSCRTGRPTPPTIPSGATTTHIQHLTGCSTTPAGSMPARPGAPRTRRWATSSAAATSTARPTPGSTCGITSHCRATTAARTRGQHG